LNAECKARRKFSVATTEFWLLINYAICKECYRDSVHEGIKSPTYFCGRTRDGREKKVNCVQIDAFRSLDRDFLFL